jgi:hypothetical protein
MAPLPYFLSVGFAALVVLASGAALRLSLSPFRASVAQDASQPVEQFG